MVRRQPETAANLGSLASAAGPPRLPARAGISSRCGRVLLLSERSCLARTGEVAAASWMEQPVDVGAVLSLLVHCSDDIGDEHGYRSRSGSSSRACLWRRAGVKGASVLLRSGPGCVAALTER